MWWTTKKQVSENSVITQQHDPFAALRFRNYRLFTIGRLLLYLGYQMQGVAVGWELYDRTGSAMVLGGVGLIQVIPIMALTLIAGDWADRFDRKLTMLFTIWLLSFCSFGLAILSITKGSIFLIYSCLLLIGIARAFSKPASDAFVWQLIPKNTFTNAATWNSSTFQFASVAGPSLGGVIIALKGGATDVYILAGILAFLCLVAVAIIPNQKKTLSKEPLSLKALSAGAKFIWNNQLILAAITLDLFAVLFGGAVFLLPIYAKDILHAGPVELGWLQAAPSIGALIMTVILAYLPPFRQTGKALLLSVVGFGAATIIFGLSRSLWLSLLMLFFTGAFDSISVIIRHTLVQIRTPNDLRGRVSAVNGVFISMSNELGGFESGLVAAFFGPIFSVVSGGIGTVLVVVAVALIWPKMWHLGALHED
ncbi:MFS transporter [[Phormidium ambiguum] IAM M-71]|uniref:MFS transporter n=1 Tax=[Phormidium ambiguum] IAM M-71 TaxID=454136 RepID=A0A1U7IBA5_9CYAN|nr:MFS transporter [Phormidium ambiguum]OKH33927.1 MFS transporter [Phormidium ambiguum IAM M-71]